mgnify:CR=1 FL=1|tara:strand:- start:1169 stop:1330 length:162 start_codon:yes stop_codon:yes gene_type:complete
MIKSDKYYKDLEALSKDLEPLEKVSLKDQDKQAKELEEETKLLIHKQKYFKGE